MEATYSDSPVQDFSGKPRENTRVVEKSPISMGKKPEL